MTVLMSRTAEITNWADSTTIRRLTNQQTDQAVIKSIFMRSTSKPDLVVGIQTLVFADTWSQVVEARRMPFEAWQASISLLTTSLLG